MAISRWDPWRDLALMQNEFSRLFDRAFGTERGRATAWVPAVDMFDRDGALVVRVELPGIKAEDVDITVVDNSLIIRGERKFTEEVKEENFYRMEQRYGSFERAVQLPYKVKVEDVKATFHDGMLEITLPEAEEEKPKQIKIRVEDEK